MKKKGKVIICLFLTIYLIICTMTNLVAILALEEKPLDTPIITNEEYNNQSNFSNSENQSEEVKNNIDETYDEANIEQESDDLDSDLSNQGNDESSQNALESNQKQDSQIAQKHDESQNSLNQTEYSVSVKLSDNQKYVTLSIQNYILSNNDSSIYAAVWSQKDGQDDLIWYELEEKKNSYSKEILIKNHNSPGPYIVHFYEVRDGKNYFITSDDFEVAISTEHQIMIENVDMVNGTFMIKVANVNVPSGINKIQIPVWCDDNQNDIVWYDAKKDNEGNYYVNVDIDNHKNHYGKYKADIYVTDGNDFRYSIGRVEQSIILNIDNIIFNATVNQSERNIQISMTNYKINKNALIRFAVWSEESGQDDLEWVEARKELNGSYSYSIDISKHKSAGKYYIHAYDEYDGQMIKLKETSIEISRPQIKLTTTDVSSMSFRIDAEITNIPNGLKLVQIPVWSKNDQSDIVWYTAKKLDDNHYYVIVDITNHSGNFGDYYYSCYTTTNTGIFTGVPTLNKKVEFKSGSLTAVLNQEESKIQINLDNLDIDALIGMIKFAVWSEENGQDDLEWVEVNRNLSGDYYHVINIARHKSGGIYNVHAYIDVNGKMIFLDKTVVNISRPNVNLSTTNLSAGVFKIEAEITNIPNGLKLVQIPVWSKNDQSDIIWYTAKKLDNNHYYVIVNITNHSGNFGNYYYSCYTTTNTEIFTGIPTQSTNVNLDGLILSANVNSSETDVQITLQGIDLTSLNGEVLFAVWSESGGQDDLIWYETDKNNASNYLLNLKIINHRTLGKYNVHAYIVVNNKNIKLSETEFSISKTATTSASISSEVRNDGKFVISIQTSALSGIDKVEVPVWCDDNQNDIFWYTAQKTSENNYQVTVDITNHKYHYGDFKYHIYTTMGNGIRTNTYQANYNFIVENYISVSRIGQGRYQVALHNPIGDNISSVLIPTWSKTNDQDDLVWYTANNIGNNVWAAEISTRNHKDSGEFISHAYIVINGVQTNVAQKTYTIPQSDFLTGMDLKAQVYTSNTNYLILVDRSIHTVGVYHGSYGNWNKVHEYLCTVGAPSTPTVVGDFAIYRKGRYFDSGASRCFYYSAFYGGYYFHSVLYYKDNEPLRIMDGRLGMNLSHGCIRLQVDNAKWIYDNCPIGTRVIIYN